MNVTGLNVWMLGRASLEGETSIMGEGDLAFRALTLVCLIDQPAGFLLTWPFHSHAMSGERRVGLDVGALGDLAAPLGRARCRPSEGVFLLCLWVRA